MDFLYELEPDLKILWAHAGMSESAMTVEAMLERYATLYADTSYREHDILRSDGTINPDWRRVLERFSNRFMVGPIHGLTVNGTITTTWLHLIGNG